MNSPSPVAQRVRATLAKRYRRERRFRFLGLAAVVFGVLSLGVLFADIFAKGVGAFRQAYVRLDVHYDPEVLGLTDPRDPQALAFADFEGVLRRALAERFPEVSTRRERRALRQLVSPVASYLLAERLAAEPALLGRRETLWLPADDDVDTYLKLRDGAGDFAGRLSEGAHRWVEALAASGDLQLRFNREFFTRADSREPEMAGIWGAVKGSFYTLLVTLAIAFPFGVAAALYLEEFAPRNRVTDLIEVNINNLAAVPSVIFGLLGLAIFINFLEVPRSTPLVGGMVLALMTLPTVIIASRVAIQAVPPSIREAALAVGASPVQVALHHVLPLAMPGILTGAIIGMARALGETAPLLMVGMVAFIADPPAGITDPATVLPVQVFLWSDSPERAFVARTSAAILVLLAFLVIMNATAVWLRQRLERRW